MNVTNRDIQSQVQPERISCHARYSTMSLSLEQGFSLRPKEELKHELIILSTQVERIIVLLIHREYDTHSSL